MKQFELDLHIHSVASGHAFSTIVEIVTVASDKGLKLIAITDHGPDMKGSVHLEYFGMGNRIPKSVKGVEILFGCEANIIDYDGNIDIPDNYLNKLDFVIVGLHKFTSYPLNSNIKQNTDTLLRTIEKYPIHCIAHPYTKDFPIEINQVAQRACEKGIFLELNNSIFKNNTCEELADVYKEMVDICKKYNGKVVFNSDAHIAYEVADFSNLLNYKNMLDITDDILISSLLAFKNFRGA